jgi:hypothetical protein
MPGGVFISHFDDGLVYPQFGQLAQLLASSFSTQIHGGKILNDVKIIKYYALAMNASEERSSPLSIGNLITSIRNNASLLTFHNAGNPGELNIVLWLNPFADMDDELDSLPDDHSDGIHIYSRAAANQLFAQGKRARAS